MNPRGVRFVHLPASELAPHAAGLRALEEDVRYPLDERDEFVIDHGPTYHPFFSQMGPSSFLLGLEGERVVAAGAAVRKDVDWNGQRIPAVYGADLKVERRLRGTGLARRMGFRALWELVSRPDLRRAHLAFGAAMVGPKGDVLRSSRGVHALKLARPLATLEVYFADPAKLRALELRNAPPPPSSPGLDLSPAAASSPPGIESTHGRKDLRVVRTGAPLQLWHLPLGPRAWTPTFGHYLRSGAEALKAHPGAIACFALDHRLEDHIAWLRTQGVLPDTRCNVHALLLRPKRRPAWVHLATSEI